MCGTCGCGQSDGIVMKIPGETKLENHDQHNHNHDHAHHHHHGHGGNLHGSSKIIEIEADILNENNLLAERNRGYFEAKNIKTFNLVSSPGSGKTSLLEKTLEALKDQLQIAVIEGDQQTMNDANRIAVFNVPVLQINTGKACHLDSKMINDGLKKLNPENDSILFIENVGNLVCPAMFDLGEAKRVVIMSVTEGDDKAIKYPDMFHGSDLCIINKIDLLPYVDFDMEKAKDYIARVTHNIEVIELSAKTGEGLQHWFSWLKNQA